MTAYLLTNHLLNFMAPAAVVAGLLVLLSRLLGLFSKTKRPLAQSFIAVAAIIFVVNMAVLVAGLIVFGHDGKMATYAAMVVGAALAMLLLQRRQKR